MAGTKEWKAVAKDMAEGCSVHYIPVEEALVHKVAELLNGTPIAQGGTNSP